MFLLLDFCDESFHLRALPQLVCNIFNKRRRYATTQYPNPGAKGRYNEPCKVTQAISWSAGLTGPISLQSLKTVMGAALQRTKQPSILPRKNM